MKQLIISALITIALCTVCILILNYIDQNSKQNEHFQSAVVILLGQCSKSACSFTYKTEDGYVMSGLSEKPVSIGQIVYQKCWETKVRGHACSDFVQ